MSEIFNCPRCNVKTYYKHEDPILLPRLVKANDGNGLATDIQHGLAVWAMVCDTCKHVDFTLILGNEDLNI